MAIGPRSGTYGRALNPKPKPYGYVAWDPDLATNLENRVLVQGHFQGLGLGIKV